MTQNKKSIVLVDRLWNNKYHTLKKTMCHRCEEEKPLLSQSLIHTEWYYFCKACTDELIINKKAKYDLQISGDVKT